MKKLLLAATVAGILSGCTTSGLTATKPLEGQTSSAGNPVAANVSGVIHGFYLFYFIPLWSGYPWAPNERDYETFKGFVKPKYMSIMMEHYRKRHKYGAVEDLEIRESSSGFWSLWIVWRRTVEGKAVMTN